MSPVWFLFFFFLFIQILALIARSGAEVRSWQYFWAGAALDIIKLYFKQKIIADQNQGVFLLLEKKYVGSRSSLNIYIKRWVNDRLTKADTHARDSSYFHGCCKMTCNFYRESYTILLCWKPILLSIQSFLFSLNTVSLEWGGAFGELYNTGLQYESSNC